MKNQLHITAIDLIGLGFKQKVIEEKSFYEEKLLFHKVIYETDSFCNTKVYYNPLEKENVWYLATTAGDGFNHLCLNIETQEQLCSFLKIVGLTPNYI